MVIGGGLDYYPGSATSSPSFSFRVTHLRLAGEGDLLARLAALRKQLEADGLFRPQKELDRPLLPKTIGVVTARGSAACQDLLAGLERRGWRGTLVWADAPVQDRRAAPAIASALRGLAEQPSVEVAVVCRGGGSLADLWAFCDESLCRTVALLRLPVISAVGHESDRTLIDDVSAVCCSTPTHAAEELVRVDVATARRDLSGRAQLVARAGAGAVRSRGQRLAQLAGGAGAHDPRRARAPPPDAPRGARLGDAPGRRAPRAHLALRARRLAQGGGGVGSRPGRVASSRHSTRPSAATTRSGRSSAATRWSSPRRARR